MARAMDNRPDLGVVADSADVRLSWRRLVALVVVEAGRSTAANIESVLTMLNEYESTVSFILNKAPASESLPENTSYKNY